MLEVEKVYAEKRCLLFGRAHYGSFIIITNIATDDQIFISIVLISKNKFLTEKILRENSFFSLTTKLQLLNFTTWMIHV